MQQSIGGPVVSLEPSVGARSKWEYLVRTREGIVKKGENDLETGMNRLGEEGWELIAIEPNLQPSGDGERRIRSTSYYFKRPRQSSSLQCVNGVVAAISVKHAKAVSLAKVLQELYAGSSTTHLSCLESTNTILVYGLPKQVTEIRMLVAGLDRLFGEEGKKAK
jgi:hypothetical protein